MDLEDNEEVKEAAAKEEVPEPVANRQSNFLYITFNLCNNPCVVAMWIIIECLRLSKEGGIHATKKREVNKAFRKRRTATQNLPNRQKRFALYL